MVSKKSKKRSYPKKWRKAKGGKLIGRGANGCIYYPKIDTLKPSCYIGNSLYEKNKYVTKVLPLRKAIEEINFSKLIILNVLNWEKYFIIPNQICLIDPDSKDDERNNFENCIDDVENNPIKLFDGKNLSNPDTFESYVGLHMEKATSDLDDLLSLKNIDITSIHFEDLIKSMIPLFEGINELVKSKIVHQDIKTPNIVYSHIKKQMFLIDVGLAQKFHESFTPKKRIFHQYSYFVYPFDWKLGFLKNNSSDPIQKYLSISKNYTPYLDEDLKLRRKENPDPVGLYSRSGFNIENPNYLNVLEPNTSDDKRQIYLTLENADDLYKYGTFMVRGTFKYIYGGIGANKETKGPIGRITLDWILERYNLATKLLLELKYYIETNSLNLYYNRFVEKKRSLKKFC